MRQIFTERLQYKRQRNVIRDSRINDIDPLRVYFLKLYIFIIWKVLAYYKHSKSLFKNIKNIKSHLVFIEIYYSKQD